MKVSKIFDKIEKEIKSVRNDEFKSQTNRMAETVACTLRVFKVQKVCINKVINGFKELRFRNYSYVLRKFAISYRYTLEMLLDYIIKSLYTFVDEKQRDIMTKMYRKTLIEYKEFRTEAKYLGEILSILT